MLQQPMRTITLLLGLLPIAALLLHCIPLLPQLLLLLAVSHQPRGGLLCTAASLSGHVQPQSAVTAAMVAAARHDPHLLLAMGLTPVKSTSSAAAAFAAAAGAAAVVAASGALRMGEV
jgi:hypothetical protein